MNPDFLACKYSSAHKAISYFFEAGVPNPNSGASEISQAIAPSTWLWYSADARNRTHTELIPFHFYEYYTF